MTIGEGFRMVTLRACEVRVVWNPRRKGADEEEVRGEGVDGADEAQVKVARIDSKTSTRARERREEGRGKSKQTKIRTPLNSRPCLDDIPLDPTSVISSGSPSPFVPVPFIVVVSLPISTSLPFLVIAIASPNPRTPALLPPPPCSRMTESEGTLDPVETVIAPRSEPHTRVERGEERIGVELGEGSLVWGGRGKRRREEEQVGMGGEEGGEVERVEREVRGGDGRRRRRSREQGGRRKGGGCSERDVGHGMRAVGEGAEDGVLDGRRKWDWGCETWSGDGEGAGRARERRREEATYIA
ncbi:hypothetical protein B0H13DRAFT_1902438 [Mycena leptocephala]|nr:hypothetical protein B0H13DRAFT_1902438 [Mycena leptocephala]